MTLFFLPFFSNTFLLKPKYKMLNLNFINFPTLKTARLILRNVSVKDYELFHKLHSDPIINRFVGRENASSLEKAKAYVKRMDGLVKNKECLFWIITLKLYLSYYKKNI